MVSSQKGVVEIISDWQSYFTTLEGKVNPELLERARSLMALSLFGLEEGQNPPLKDPEYFDIDFFSVLLDLNKELVLPEEPDAYIICRVSPEMVRTAFIAIEPKEAEEPRELTLQEMQDRELLLRVTMATHGIFFD